MALVVFTGGARSGKSAAAQRLAQDRHRDGATVMVAAFGRSDDAEMAQRIARHQAERPGAFSTLEVTDPAVWLGEVPSDVLLVVDCLGTMLGRAMELAWDHTAHSMLGDAPADALPPGFAEEVSLLFDPVVDSLAARPGDTIVVTNEVGDGVVPGYASGRLFRDLLGQANRTLVSAADAAYLCVAGRLLDLSALPLEAHWPED